MLLVVSERVFSEPTDEALPAQPAAGVLPLTGFTSSSDYGARLLSDSPAALPKPLTHELVVFERQQV